MTHLATIRKNQREEVRVSVDEFKGRKLLNVRVWFEAEAGEYRPGKQGIALRLDLVPELVAAIREVGQ